MVEVFCEFNHQDQCWYVGFTTSVKTYTLMVTKNEESATKLGLNLQSYLMNV